MNLVGKSFAKMKSESVPAALLYLAVRWKTLVIVIVPLVFIPLAMMEGKAAKCGYVLCVMAMYWMTEALPLPVTSLIPIVAFPLFGILSSNDVCMLYFKETNVMFMGGLIVAIAVEHCNLHRRIALRVLLTVGTSPRRLMFGFMLTTMFLSMWISNSAATAMMVPIVSAILSELNSIQSLEGQMLEARQKLDESLQPTEGSPAEKPSEEEEEERPEKQTIKTTDQSTHTENVFEAQVDKGSVSGIEIEKGVTRPTPEQVCYFLSVAYSANIGGTGTITGTATNLVFKGIVESIFIDAEGINFATWMEFNVPLMLLNTLLAWLWLQVVYMCACGKRRKKQMKLTKAQKTQISQLIRKNYDALGPMSFHEYSVLALFLLDILLWFFRKPEFITGWAVFFPDVPVKDATAATLVVLLLFILPANLNFLKCDKRLAKPCPPLLTWRALEEKLPIGIILLLGSGYSISKACEVSGLSNLMGDSMRVVDRFPLTLTLAVILFATTFATEICSNTAMANIMLPVLARMSRVMRVHPLYLMLPTTICCSFAFMLPVATPPNAIVVTASNMPSIEMIKTGLGMNIICVFTLLVTFTYIGVPMYHLEHFPKWAEIKNSTS